MPGHKWTKAQRIKFNTTMALKAGTNPIKHSSAKKRTPKYVYVLEADGHFHRYRLHTHHLTAVTLERG